MVGLVCPVECCFIKVRRKSSVMVLWELKSEGNDHTLHLLGEEHGGGGEPVHRVEKCWGGSEIRSQKAIVEGFEQKRDDVTFFFF